jgi:elongation factor 1 alpha-like protein
MGQFLSQAGYVAANVSFIPCSGLDGVNLISRPEIPELKWYTGPTLLETLGIAISGVSNVESVPQPSRSLDLPLRMSIADISKGPRANLVNVVGRVDSGILQIGDVILSKPGDSKGVVKSILP